MNNNTQQIKQEEKFKLKDLIIVFSDLFATTKEKEEVELDKEVEEIKLEQNSSYIEKLEKEICDYGHISKRRNKVKTQSVKNNNVSTKKVKSKVQDEKDDMILEDYEK